MLPKAETLVQTNYPKNLVLETISYCNLRCRLCPYKDLLREKGFMSLHLYARIIEEIAGFSPETVLWLAFMGEPLLLGMELCEKIKYAKAAGIQNVSLNTNGTLLIEPFTRGLINAGVDKIYVSLDAVSDWMYRVVRDDYKLLQITNNVLHLLEEAKSSETEVIVQFVVTEDNAGELELFKESWLEAGATVKIRKKLGWGGKVPSPDYIQESREGPCSWLMRQMIVLWDGTVAQCDADYEGKYFAGNLKSESIEDVWNRVLYRRRERHLKGDFDFEPCKSCKDWQVGISEVLRP